MASDLEELLAYHIRAKRLPEPLREYQAIPGRKYSFDFAWPNLGPGRGLLTEVNGGTWKKMGHSSGKGIERDYEKMILAQLAGWRVFLVTGDQVRSGQAIRWIEEALTSAQ